MSGAEGCLDYHILIAHPWLTSQLLSYVCWFFLFFAGHSAVGPSALSSGVEFDARIRRSTHTHGHELFQLRVIGVSMLYSIDREQGLCIVDHIQLVDTRSVS
jgi:hypothetical protein